MKKMILALLMVLSVSSVAADAKLSEKILGRWSFDVPAALVEMEKNLGGPVPPDIKDQVVRELKGSSVIIEKAKITILYPTEDRSVDYTVVSERKNQMTAEFKAEQGQMITKTLTMKGDLLYVSEGSKVMMILKRTPKK
jgi:hypothetical protein